MVETQVVKRKSGGAQPGSGKPALQIDRDKLYLLAQTLLPVETIAAVLGCSHDVIYDRYGDVLQAGRANRKATLSQTMWHKAIVEKDTKMLIWLSKQHLGYKEPQNDHATVVPIQVIINPFPE